MVNSDFIKDLNKAQKEAVIHLDGPLLIVAGAGSGKTKVLTARIANIIKEKKAFPNQILAVTFTNKAAKEMHTRFCSNWTLMVRNFSFNLCKNFKKTCFCCKFEF
jgi:DNA helicase-2/ATP-dependent DNA helicase PcrA